MRSQSGMLCLIQLYIIWTLFHTLFAWRGGLFTLDNPKRQPVFYLPSNASTEGGGPTHSLFLAAGWTIFSCLFVDVLKGTSHQFGGVCSWCCWIGLCKYYCLCEVWSLIFKLCHHCFIQIFVLQYKRYCKILAALQCYGSSRTQILHLCLRFGCQSDAIWTQVATTCMQIAQIYPILHVHGG